MGLLGVLSLNMMSKISSNQPLPPGAYITTHTHDSSGVTGKMKILKSIDMDKRIVYIGVMEHAESKPDLIF